VLCGSFPEGLLSQRLKSYGEAQLEPVAEEAIAKCLELFNGAR